MARPPRSIDPADGPVPRFATELRKLREEAGAPPYRLLADRAHFSRATLAAAAAGYRLPTWEVTSAYVDACGGDVEEWRKRWEATRSELGLEVPENTAEVGGGDDRPPAPGPSRRWRGPALAGAVGGLTVVAAASVFAALHLTTSTPPPARGVAAASARFVPTGPLSSQPVADGADPKRSGCASDPRVTTVDSVELNASDEHFLGVVELRYSPRCGVAWGRFTPAVDSVRLAGSTVTITAQRQGSDPASAPYETAYDGQAVFGNILLIDHGCVRVSVVVAMFSGRAGVTTECRAPGR